jgi:hypothetical protein
MPMAEAIALTFFVSVWALSMAFSGLVRRLAPDAVGQCAHIERAGLATATLGAFALWLFFTINGVTAAAG